MSDNKKTAEITIDVLLPRKVTLIAEWGIDGAEAVRVLGAEVNLPTADDVFNALEASNALEDFDRALEAVLPQPPRPEEDLDW